jgi:hypothetical protein
MPWQCMLALSLSVYYDLYALVQLTNHRGSDKECMSTSANVAEKFFLRH